MRRFAIVSVLVAFAAINVHALPAAAAEHAVVRDVEAARDLVPATGDFQEDTTTEPSIAVNPTDPLHVVTVYQGGRHEDGGAQFNGFATSFDGGVTWTFGPLPKLTIDTGGSFYDRASDPVVAFGPGGNAVYALSLLVRTIDPETIVPTTDLGLSISRDGGRTWGDPIVIPNPVASPIDDKPWFTVDRGTGAGHHTGRLYLAWSASAVPSAMYSDDEGQTWFGPFSVPNAGAGMIPLVMPNGDLAAVSVKGGNFRPEQCGQKNEFGGDDYLISLARGAGAVPTGGSLQFSSPTTIAQGCFVDVELLREGDGLPTAAVDARGRIYVAWTDTRFRTDEAHDIVLSSSDDGTNWSPVRRVNPGATDDFLEHVTPALAAGSDGIVRLSYRTHQQTKRAKNSPPFVDTVYQQSLDGGSTWSGPLVVNTTPTDIRFAAFTFFEEAFLGDYNEVAVAGSWAYVVRAEAFQLDPSEPATFPATVTHQRTFVAVVDSDGDGTL